MDVSRRSFILSGTAATAGGALVAQALAQPRPGMAAASPPRGFNPNDLTVKYDLVIAGGEVIDPSQKLRARRDAGRVPGLGTLQVGAPADVTIMDLVDGPVEFVDTRKNTRQGTKRLLPVLTVREGRPFGRPPLPTPFIF